MNRYIICFLLSIIAILAIIFFQNYNKNEVYNIHRRYVVNFSGKSQVVNILDINLSKYKMKPILSNNNLFGFEKTSKMAQNNNAYAAVNGTFMDELGVPMGIILIDNNLITNKTQGNPIFYITKDNKAFIDNIKFIVNLKSENKTIELDGFNKTLKDDNINVFNKDFGYNNRYIGRSYNILVENNKVVKSFYSNDVVDIPQTGFLITATGTKIEEIKNLKSYLNIEYKNSKDLRLIQAIECGSWIIKDKQKLIQTYDNWIGNTTTQEPRTVIATKNNNVLLITVDGRQIPYSSGFNCYELYEYLRSLDVDNACYLDGGGSTTMVINGTIINKPSFLGRERKVSNAIGVFSLSN